MMTALGGKTTTTTATMMAVADQIKEAAWRAVALLNREAHLSANESNYAAIEGERDRLRRRLAERDAEANECSAERDGLAAELEGAREELRRWRGGDAAAADAAVSSERARHSETWAELELAGERTDRMDREADGLRAEISRLARTNGESAALLSAMPSQHSCSSGKTAPLRLQVRRFEQELDAVSSHSNYLDGKLSNRNNEIASLKRNHLVRVWALRSELDGVQLVLERT